MTQDATTFQMRLIKIYYLFPISKHIWRYTSLYIHSQITFVSKLILSKCILLYHFQNNFSKMFTPKIFQRIYTATEKQSTMFLFSTAKGGSSYIAATRNCLHSCNFDGEQFYSRKFIVTPCVYEPLYKFSQLKFHN